MTFMDMGKPLSEMMLLLTVGAAMVHDLSYGKVAVPDTAAAAAGTAGAADDTVGAAEASAAAAAARADPTAESTTANTDDTATTPPLDAPKEQEEAHTHTAPPPTTGLNTAKVAEFAQEVAAELCAAGFLRVEAEAFRMPSVENFPFNLPLNLRGVVGKLLQATRVFAADPAAITLAKIALSVDDPTWQA